MKNLFWCVGAGLLINGHTLWCAEAAKSLTNSVGMEFVRIPSGKFQMGSPDSEAGRHAQEGPVHEVVITKDYYLAKTEVTQAQWEKVMGGATWKENENFKMEGAYGLGPDHPVYYVSWEEAQLFLKKLNELETGKVYRLPTEAEWEYAARAGTNSAYSFGDDSKELNAYAWTEKNSKESSQATAQKQPNPWGLYDIYGNVWEWVLDKDGEGDDTYPDTPQVDPTGAKEGEGYRKRGGSFRKDASYCRSATRGANGPDVREDDLGFRVLLETQ